MTRLVLSLLAISGICAGQIVVRNHASGAPVVAPAVLPDVAVNDYEDQLFDVVNTGAASATVESAVTTGLFYSLCCKSAFVLGPGESQTLTVHFAPKQTGYFTGSLQIDSLIVLLFARSLPAASLFVQTASGLIQAHSGVPLNLVLDATFTGQIPCLLENNFSGPVTISVLSVSGDWALAGGPVLPDVLQPGEQASFALTRVSPAAGTTLAGTVIVNQWPYAIGGHPPMPNIHLNIPDSLLSSNQQTALSINFDPAPTTSISGTVNLSFEAAGSSLLIDPAIVFTSTGTTTAPFTSIPGQSAAAFGTSSSLTFQTGTTAGTLHIQAEWGYSEDQIDIQLQASPVVIEAIVATRAANTLDVTVTGYDNTRTAGRLSFSFFDSQGAFIGTPITADFTELFSSFFFQADYNSGGIFKMDAQFPVTGGANNVNAVQVDLMNSAGDAQSSVTRFN